MPIEVGCPLGVVECEVVVGWSCLPVGVVVGVLAVVGLSCLLPLEGQGLGVVCQIPVLGDPASSPSLLVGVGSVLSLRLFSRLFSWCLKCGTL